MSTSGIADRNDAVIDFYQALSPDKETVEFWRITAFKSSQLAGKHCIERICDHGHRHIEMNFDKNGRGKSIEMEKLYSLGDAIFHSPSSRIVADKQFRWCVEIVADQEGWLFMTVAGDNNLS